MIKYDVEIAQYDDRGEPDEGSYYIVLNNNAVDAEDDDFKVNSDIDSVIGESYEKIAMENEAYLSPLVGLDKIVRNDIFFKYKKDVKRVQKIIQKLLTR